MGALDNFPNNIEIREQLIRIAKEENDEQEVISQLKKIISINPKNEKNKKSCCLWINIHPEATAPF